MGAQSLLPYKDFISSGIFTLHVGPSLKRFDIHKALLSSVSEEFKKHVYNEMIEGTSGEMTLADEREDTVARFIEWVYTGQYPDPEPPSEDPTVAGETEEARFMAAINSLSTSDRQEALLQSNSSDLEEDGDPVLMTHAMLYVFADRFNVQKLKQQTFAKLTARIVTIDVPRKRKSRLAIIYLVSYAFGNLPQCRPSEPLLEYLGVYASWILESLREEPEFFDLLESDIDFLKELLRHVRRGEQSPVGSGG